MRPLSWSCTIFTPPCAIFWRLQWSLNKKAEMDSIFVSSWAFCAQYLGVPSCVRLHPNFLELKKSLHICFFKIFLFNSLREVIIPEIIYSVGIVSGGGDHISFLVIKLGKLSQMYKAGRNWMSKQIFLFSLLLSHKYLGW